MDNIFLIPDKGTYKVTKKFFTNKYESINGVVYSEPFLTKAKTLVQYDVTINNPQLQRYFTNYFKNTIHYWGSVSMPDFSMNTTVTANNNSTRIYIDNSLYIYTTGMVIYIFTDGDIFEVREIVGTTSTYIDVSESILTTVGMVLCPTFIGAVSGSIKNKYANSNSITVGVSIEELRGY